MLPQISITEGRVVYKETTLSVGWLPLSVIHILYGIIIFDAKVLDNIATDEEKGYSYGYF